MDIIAYDVGSFAVSVGGHLYYLTAAGTLKELTDEGINIVAYRASSFSLTSNGALCYS